MRQIFICEKCEAQYLTAEAAQLCESRLDDDFAAGISVGDIVTCGGDRRFAWFNGNQRWVSSDTPGDPSARDHFDRGRAFGFFYVVTAVTFAGHQKHVHLRTKAMDGVKGYAGGWTSRNHLGSLEKVENPPEFVVSDSKDLIDQQEDHLL